jgi:hypothetical protein
MAAAAAARRRARDRYHAHQAAKAEAAAAAAEAVAEVEQEQAGQQTAQPAGILSTKLSHRSAKHAAVHFEEPAGSGGAGNGARPDLLTMRRLTRSESLRIDEDYDAFLAYWVDNLVLGVLFFGYTLTVILIFVCQSGYIDLFD